MMLLVAGTVLASGSVFGSAWAQESAPAATASAPAAPTWSDAEFEAVAKLLTGSFVGDAPLPDGTTRATILSAAPVTIAGLSDALYVEIAFANEVHLPFRQVLWQIHRKGGNVAIRTLELRRSKAMNPALNGLWAAPEAFHGVTADDVVATMDITLTKDGAGYRGASAHAYPTRLGGAVEMSSEIAFDGTKLSVADRGFDGAGKQVWGPASGTSTTFARGESPVKVTRMNQGLVRLDYPGQVSGDPAAAPKIMAVHYVGYLPDGRVFDSSIERGIPFEYAYGTPLIEGWNQAMQTVRKGERVRLVIPGPLAYGERGRPPMIRPNTTLTFDVEILDIKDPPAPEEPAPNQPAPAQPTGDQPANPQ